ncbi:helix-turn-helix domain-containing protein [Streptomyces xinghaiensis]|uniref:helix-turn-helix domain-containing protein n=1 Tax=Streptomyces xinghaiensis TaxID=1038928 RepID=UPI003442C44A
MTRVRIADGPHPLWEIAASLHRLQTRHGRWAYASWHRTAVSALHDTGLDSAVKSVLVPLFPRASYFPDFLTPLEGKEGLTAGIDTLLATPPPEIARETSRFARSTGTPSWIHRLSEGRTLREVVRVLRAYHDAVITPYEETLHARLHAERTHRAGALFRSGVEEVLGTLAPTIRWRHPFLEIDAYPDHRDVHLDGRGLLLIPSYFCWNTPVTLADPDLPPVLLYPLHHAPATSPPAEKTPLPALLGATRTAVLRATAAGATTTEAARRSGVTPTTASHHTTVLRDAGLIASHRHANTVLHTLTPLGAALLKQHAAP